MSPGSRSEGLGDTPVETHQFTRDVVVIGGCGRVGLPLGIALAACGLGAGLWWGMPTAARAAGSLGALLERKPEHRTARVEELGFMDAVFALAEQSSALHVLHKPLSRLADLIDDVAPVIRLHYGEAAEATSRALGLLEVAR